MDLVTRLRLWPRSMTPQDTLAVEQVKVLMKEAADRLEILEKMLERLVTDLTEQERAILSSPEIYLEECAHLSAPFCTGTITKNGDDGSTEMFVELTDLGSEVRWRLLNANRA